MCETNNNLTCKNENTSYHAFFKANHVIMLLVEPESMEIKDANPAACSFYKYTYEDLTKMKITDINDLPQEQIAANLRVITKEERSYFMFKHRLADGEVRDVEVYSGPVVLDGKKLLYAIIHDVTDRIKAEAALIKSEERLAFALESNGDGVWDWNVEKDELFYSRNWREIVGLRGGVMLYSNDEWSERIHPDDKERVLKSLTDHLEGRTPVYASEYRLRSKDDQYIWILDRGKVVSRSAEGKPLRFVGTDTDITERKQMEMAVVAAEELFRNVIESSSDAFYRRNLDNDEYDYVSPVIEKLMGYEVDEISRVKFMDLIHPDDQFIVKRVLEEAKLHRNVFDEMEYRSLCKDGQYRWFRNRFTTIEGNGKLPSYRYGAIQDITEQKKKEEEILYLGYHDALTGLYNRRFFEEELKRLNTERKLPLSIIIGDINGLKLTNDVFGHLEGDQILVSAANILKKVCRADDIVARWGGDEFILLLPQTSDETAKEICLRIDEACKKEESKTLKPSMSLGYASKTKSDEDIMQVLKVAEDFMYRRKLLESRSLRSSIVASMRMTLQEKNHETEKHAARLKQLCRDTAVALHVSEMMLDEVELLAVLHDIGKIAINDAILNKPGSLTDDEWREMQRHPEIGYHIAKSAPELDQIAEYILAHHERWDGAGYPRSLRGEEIPLLARIVAVVDAFDAMTSDRPYRKAMPAAEAIRELEAHAGTQFDPEVVKVFVDLVR